MVRSSLFRTRSNLPAFQVASTPVVGTRLDDSTVALSLPILPSQTTKVTVIVDHYSGYVAGAVDIRGLRTSSYPFTPAINLIGMPVIVTSAVGPIAIGSYPLGGIGVYGGLAMLNLRQQWM